MDQDTQEFLQGLEKENGGPIIFKTYAILLQTEEIRGTARQSGGLLYLINDTLYFEDFEKQPSVFGLIMPRKKQTYEKLKTQLPISSIQDVFTVRASDARAAASDRKESTELKPVTGFKKKLFQTAVCIKTSHSRPWLLEVLNDNEFIREIKEKIG
ncbi:MAG: hypothetical protein K9L21_02655 [Spirochaetia bacterium]|nr:hypothetical protein [Spirochaetia bacterium]